MKTLRRMSAQRGLTLVEMMIAMVIALFVLGALIAVFESNNKSYIDNQSLTQLEDSERFSLTVLSEVTELGGYFPDPTTQDASTEFPSDTLFPAATSIVSGTSGGSTGDTLAVRFVTAPNDGLLNCSGGENTGAADTLYENVFSVDAQGELVCSLNGAAAQPLVSGVKTFTVEYGVNSNPDATNMSFDTYKTAAQMSATDWSNVACVKVTLVFFNPLANEPGQPATITVTRVIAIMSKTGLSSMVAQVPNNNPPPDPYSPPPPPPPLPDPGHGDGHGDGHGHGHGHGRGDSNGDAHGHGDGNADG